MTIQSKLLHIWIQFIFIITRGCPNIYILVACLCYITSCSAFYGIPSVAYLDLCPVATKCHIFYYCDIINLIFKNRISYLFIYFIKLKIASGVTENQAARVSHSQISAADLSPFQFIHLFTIYGTFLHNFTHIQRDRESVGCCLTLFDSLESIHVCLLALVCWAAAYNEIIAVPVEYISMFC